MQDVDVLLRRALREGDRRAFDALHAATYQSVFRMAMSFLRSSEEAEDVVQAAFLLLHSRGRRISDQKAFSTWMWRTVRFLSMRLQREKKRRKGAELNQPDSRANADRAELGELLEKLNPDDRRLLLLRYFHGLSVEEVGQALNLTTAAAQMRIGRALERAKRKGGPGLLAVLLGLASASNSDAVVPPSPLSGNVSLRAHQLASSHSAGAVLLHSLGGLGLPLTIGSSTLACSLAIGYWLLHRPPAVDVARLDSWSKQLEGRYRGISNVNDSVIGEFSNDVLVVARRMKNPDRLELRRQEGDRPVESLSIYPVLNRNEVCMDGQIFPSSFGDRSIEISIPKHEEDIYFPSSKLRDEVSGETRISWGDNEFKFWTTKSGTRYRMVTDMKLKRSQN